MSNTQDTKKITETHPELWGDETYTGDHYRCVGNVRGWCGVRHRSWEAALRCCEEDSKGCCRQGGYSDRSVWLYDGSEKQVKT